MTVTKDKRKHTLQWKKVAVQTHWHTQPRTVSDITSTRVILLKSCQILGIFVESGSCASYSCLDGSDGDRKQTLLLPTLLFLLPVLYLIRLGKSSAWLAHIALKEPLSLSNKLAHLYWQKVVASKRHRTNEAGRKATESLLAFSKENCQNNP